MSNDSKKLYRSTDDRWLGGVCGGLGQYFNMDAIIIRIIFIILGLIGLGGVILYVILWIIIPEQPSGAGAAADVFEAEPATEEKAPAEEQASAEDEASEDS